MSAAAIKVFLKLASDKRTWKIIGSAFIIIALIVTAVGTSCTAHNLQVYTSDQIAKDYAPLIAKVNAEIEEGELNTPLLYAVYITVFDNSKYPDKDTIRGQLLRCFYTESSKKVAVVDENGNAVLDEQGKPKYLIHMIALPISDTTKIFNEVEDSFHIQINDNERAYIQNLSELLLPYSVGSISSSVSSFVPLISKYCSQYGIPDYVSLVMAVMQQESGGSGTDPMQCSESPYNTKYAHSPNSITDPDYSIQIGVQYLASCLKAAKCKSPQDIQGISLALQGYNFGNGYITWALKKGGYTQENAAEFSQMEASELGWQSYGDINYVSHVLRYYSTTGEENPNGGLFAYPIQTGKYTITSLFGSRSNPTGKGTQFHKGVDFAAPYCTPIHASESGTVIYAQFGSTPYTGYGNLVVIQHSSYLVSMYGHCAQLLVSNGQKVQKGQTIALVGSTGDSTGNHCHFEIRKNGKAVDPMLYLK